MADHRRLSIADHDAMARGRASGKPSRSVLGSTLLLVLAACSPPSTTSPPTSSPTPVPTLPDSPVVLVTPAIVPNVATADLSGPVGSIAEVMANRPPAGEPVEVDVWRGEGYLDWPGRGRLERATGCPSVDTAPLTDRRLWQTLYFNGHIEHNQPPEGAPYLIAVPNPDMRFADPEDSAHLSVYSFMRVRGHFPSPDAYDCPDEERFFVIDEILDLNAYRINGPRHIPVWTSVNDWIEVHSPQHGIRLRIPPSWQVSGSRDDLYFQAAEWAGKPLQFHVGLEAAPTPTPPGRYSAHSRWPGGFEQGWVPRHYHFDRQRLPIRSPIRTIRQQSEPSERPESESSQLEMLEFEILADGKRYTVRQAYCTTAVNPRARPTLHPLQRPAAPLQWRCHSLVASSRWSGASTVSLPLGFTAAVHYGLGHEAVPGLLRTIDLVLDTLVIEAMPTLTPLPSPAVELGPGPYISSEEAIERAYQHFEESHALDREHYSAGSEIISEGQALEFAACDMGRDAPAGRYRFPEAVWIVALGAPIDSVHMTYLNAADGEVLCSAYDSYRYDWPVPIATTTPTPGN